MNTEQLINSLRDFNVITPSGHVGTIVSSRGTLCEVDWTQDKRFIPLSDLRPVPPRKADRSKIVECMALGLDLEALHARERAVRCEALRRKLETFERSVPKLRARFERLGLSTAAIETEIESRFSTLRAEVATLEP